MGKRKKKYEYKMYSESEVRCPFFKTRDERRIKCEGPFKGTSVNIAFNSVTQTQKILDGHCCGNFLLCPMYELIKKKYE